MTWRPFQNIERFDYYLEFQNNFFFYRYCLGEELSAEEEKSFWEEMKMKLMGKEGEDYECDDDDDDDDDDHHEKEDKVFETDRFADEEHHKNHHKKHRMRCHHHKRIHKIMKIAAPIVGLVVLITIVAIVAWYV